MASVMLLAASLAAQDTIAAGTYKGKWNGASGGGDIHITFRDGAPTPEIGFTLGGQEVTCKVISYKAEGGKFKLVSEFDAQGTLLQFGDRGGGEVWEDHRGRVLDDGRRSGGGQRNVEGDGSLKYCVCFHGCGSLDL